MNTRRAAVLTALALAACGRSTTGTKAPTLTKDAGPTADAGSAAEVDGGTPDAGTADAGATCDVGQRCPGSLECDPSTRFCVTCVNDDSEPNDTPSEATHFGSADAGISVLPGRRLCPGDVDDYTIDVRTGESILVEADLASSLDAVSLVLSDDTGVLSQVQSNGPRLQVTGTASHAGKLLVQVSQVVSEISPADKIRYDLQLARGSACIPDGNASVFSAAALAAGAQTSGAICPGSDDWYAIALQAGQTISLQLASSSAALGLALVAPDATSVVTRSENQSVGQVIVQPVFATGNYYVRVYGLSTASAAQFILRASVSAACPDDSLQPNDIPAQATPVSQNSVQYQSLTLCPGRQEWFSVALLPGQILSAQVTYPASGGALDVSVIEPDMVTVAAAGQGGAGSQYVSFAPSAAGTYYVQVAGVTSLAENGFSMQIQVSGAACTPDPNEQNGGPLAATSLDPSSDGGTGAVTRGLSICPGDEDWFSRTLLAGQTITASVNAGAAQGVLHLELRASDGLTVLAAADTNAQSANITWAAVSSGLYYLRVVGRTAATTNTYGIDVQVQGSSCTNDAHEPNDTFSTATDIAASVGNSSTPTTSVAGTICNNDVDFFKLPASAGQTILGELDYARAAGALNFCLVDTDGQTWIDCTWWNSSTADNGYLAPYTVTNTGTYYLRVWGESYFTTNSYGLKMSLSGNACTSDSNEPNDTFSTATDIAASVGTSGRPATGVVGSICNNDTDFFKLTASAGQTILGELDYSRSAGALNFCLVDTDGQTFIDCTWWNASTTDNGYLAPYTVTKTGTYYLRVWGESYFTTNAYSLKMSLSGNACTNDANEPNDTFSAATDINASVGTSGNPGTGVAGSICNNDTDFFKFTASAGQTILGELDYSRSAGALNFCLVGTDGQTWLDCTWWNSSSYDNGYLAPYTVPQTGTYYLRVWGESYFTTNAYSLKMSLSGNACAADPNEPNDTFSAATDINASVGTSGNPGTGVAGSICNNDTDFFKFTASAGQTILGELDYSRSAGALNFCLVDTDGKTWIDCTWWSSSSNDNGYLPPYTATKTGTYYVQIWGQSYFTTNAYSLKMALSGSACPTDANEPNDTYATATDARAGSYPSSLTTGVAGGICNGDNDWFKLNASAGQTILGELDYSRSAGALNFCLVDTDGKTWLDCTWWNTSNNDNGYLAPYTVTKTGTYYLLVWGESYFTTNSYTLKMNLSGNACAADPNEPNDTYSAATDARAGSYPSSLTAGVAGSICNGDNDWFKLNASAGQTILGELDYSRSAGALNFCLVDTDGKTWLDCTWWNSSSYDNGYLPPYTATKTGTYYVIIYGESYYTTNSYTLKMNLSGSACTKDAYDPNGSFNVAPTLNPGTYNNLSICVGEQDWFAVSAAAGKVIGATTTYNAANGDVCVGLYARDGVTWLTGVCPSGTGTAALSYTVPANQGGTYYVEDWGRTYYTVNNYNLTLSVQ